MSCGRGILNFNHLLIVIGKFVSQNGIGHESGEILVSSYFLVIVESLDITFEICNSDWVSLVNNQVLASKGIQTRVHGNSLAVVPVFASFMKTNVAPIVTHGGIGNNIGRVFKFKHIKVGNGLVQVALATLKDGLYLWCEGAWLTQ